MAQTTYQVILSTDGKHTVIITTDDVKATEDALVLAKNAYDRVVKRYGLKLNQDSPYQRGPDTDIDSAPTLSASQL